MSIATPTELDKEEIWHFIFSTINSSNSDSAPMPPKWEPTLSQEIMFTEYRTLMRSRLTLYRVWLEEEKARPHFYIAKRKQEKYKTWCVRTIENIFAASAGRRSVDIHSICIPTERPFVFVFTNTEGLAMEGVVELDKFPTNLITGGVHFFDYIYDPKSEVDGYLSEFFNRCYPNTRTAPDSEFDDSMDHEQLPEDTDISIVDRIAALRAGNRVFNRRILSMPFDQPLASEPKGHAHGPLPLSYDERRFITEAHEDWHKALNDYSE